METEKILFSYYKIDENFIADRKFAVVIDDIIRITNAREGAKYTEQQTIKEDYGSVKLRVFFSLRTAPARWRYIFRKIVKKGEPITICESVIPSYIMFAEVKKSIFAVTGGLGSFAIQGFVSQHFGIDILSRLIKADSPVIKSFQNRGVTGVLLAQSKHFRKDRRLMDENSFGQIYKELKVDLDRQILTEIFSFKPSELKRKMAGCLAKTSFQISKPLDETGFVTVAKRLNSLLDRPPNFSINNMELISGKKSLMLIRKLQQAFITTIYEGYVNGEVLDIDFCHPEVDKYRSAAYYCLPQTDLPAREDAFELNELLRELQAAGKLDVKDEQGFKRLLQHTEIQTQDEAGLLLTSGSIYEHLNGEVTVDQQTYFFIDGSWYRIKPSFVVELNRELKQLLEQHWDDTLITVPFDAGRGEGAFNISFAGKPGFVVLDKIVPENIEACDLLHHSDKGLHLIHVKQGFDGRVRDLAAQVLLAAKRVEQDVKTGGYRYIQALEDRLKAGAGSDSAERRKLAAQTLPEGGLQKPFAETRPKDICFSFAFTHTVGKGRSLKNNITAYRSNIAKYSLLLLIREVIAMGFDFKVIQLEVASSAKKTRGKKVPGKKAYTPGVDGAC